MPYEASGNPFDVLNLVNSAYLDAKPSPIADILYTGNCVPGSVFLVENIDYIPVAPPEPWRGIRLLLGDGELCIQAILRSAAHRRVDKGEVVVGSDVQLDSFSLHIQDVAVNAAGERETNEIRLMIYLDVEDLVPVGRNEAYFDIIQGKQVDPTDQGKAHEDGVDEEGVEKGDGNVLEADGTSEDATRNAVAASSRRRTAMDNDDETDDDEDIFEVMGGSNVQAIPNRANSSGATRPIKPTSGKHAPVSLLKDWTDHTTPLKLTPLRAVPLLPYKQNWSVNVLAVVASISEPGPSHLPPHTQRTARLTDPSTTKQVLLTVFLDPEAFAPKVGSVVLLGGVKNHRFDGGSLKKYASDKPKDGERWWFEEPWDMEWCDVARLKDWWRTRQASTSEE
jgi:hypothetical protein